MTSPTRREEGSRKKRDGGRSGGEAEEDHSLFVPCQHDEEDTRFGKVTESRRQWCAAAVWALLDCCTCDAPLSSYGQLICSRDTAEEHAQVRHAAVVAILAQTATAEAVSGPRRVATPASSHAALHWRRESVTGETLQQWQGKPRRTQMIWSSTDGRVSPRTWHCDDRPGPMFKNPRFIGRDSC